LRLINKISKEVSKSDTYRLEDITSEYVSLFDCPAKFKLCKLIQNNQSGFDDFINTKAKDVSNKEYIIEVLDSILILLIQGEPIPPNKVKSIGSNEFEIRIGRTRLYFFLDHPDKKIIVLGHYNKSSNDQQKYIEKFRIIKQGYLKSK